MSAIRRIVTALKAGTAGHTVGLYLDADLDLGPVEIR